MPPPNSLYYAPNATDAERRVPRPATGTYHYGWDFDQDKGAPIYTNKPLKVVDVESGNKPGWGRNVVLEDDTGRRYRFAHLDKIGTNVKEGSTLPSNSLLGTVGSTGSTISKGGDGSHLHFEVLEKNSNGQYKHVDPAMTTNPRTGGGAATVARFGQKPGDLVTTSAKPITGNIPPPPPTKEKDPLEGTIRDAQERHPPEKDGGQTQGPIITPMPGSTQGIGRARPSSGNVGIQINPMLKGNDTRGKK